MKPFWGWSWDPTFERRCLAAQTGLRMVLALGQHIRPFHDISNWEKTHDHIYDDQKFNNEHICCLEKMPFQWLIQSQYKPCFITSVNENQDRFNTSFFSSFLALCALMAWGCFDVQQSKVQSPLPLGNLGEWLGKSCFGNANQIWYV